MSHTTDEFLLLAMQMIEAQRKQIEVLYASHISLISVVHSKLGIPTDELERVPESVIQAIREKDPVFAAATTTIRAAVRELEQKVPGSTWTDTAL